MTLQDPVAVYQAAHNNDAHGVCLALRQHGIDAHVVEDNSPAGMFAFGLLPGIHKPQVFVERADVERATGVVEEFERLRRRAGEKDAGRMLEIVCEDCGDVAKFSADLRGCVETCPHCGGFVDVVDGEEDDFDWPEDDDAAADG